MEGVLGPSSNNPGEARNEQEHQQGTANTGSWKAHHPLAPAFLAFESLGRFGQDLNQVSACQTGSHKKLSQVVFRKGNRSFRPWWKLNPEEISADSGIWCSNEKLSFVSLVMIKLPTKLILQPWNSWKENFKVLQCSSFFVYNVDSLQIS